MSKFKVGDRVECKQMGVTGTLVDIDNKNIGTVKRDDGVPGASRAGWVTDLDNGVWTLIDTSEAIKAVTAPPKPSRDERIAKALIVTALATIYGIDSEIIPESQIKPALLGLAGALDFIATREYPQWAETDMVTKVTRRVNELGDKIDSGELPGG